jgi:hypothetical protein
VQCCRFLEKRMLPEDSPVRLKHVVNIHFYWHVKHFNKHFSDYNVNWCHNIININIVAL